MDAHNIFINQRNGYVSTAPASKVGSVPSVILGTTSIIKVAFVVAGAPAAIAGYTADSLRLVVKPVTEPNAESSVFPDGAWTVSGNGVATRYTWTGLVDSVQLEAIVGAQLKTTLRAQIEWRISGDTNPIKSQPFDLVVINSPARLDDGAPDVAGSAAKLWLVEQLAEGDNITLDVDPVTKIITINADAPNVVGAMTYKGGINASANPNYPAATQGDTWVISAAGKIGGSSGVVVEIGDVIVCQTTAVTGNHATVGTSWTILQSNISGITSDGLALMQAASTSIQRGLLGLQLGIDAQTYRAVLDHYATRSTNANFAALVGIPADFIELNSSISDAYASSIGVAGPGTIKTVKFTATCTLNHNATTFILPTGANIVAAAGDVVTFRSTNGSTASWICTAYQRATGVALSSTPLVRASGVLQGYTVAPVAAQYPVISYSVTGSITGSGVMVIESDVASPLTLTFAITNPSDGTTWIDTSDLDQSTVASHLAYAIGNYFGADVTLDVDGEDSRYHTAHRNASGASVRLQITSNTYGGVIATSLGGYGVDAVTGSGQITEIILIPKVAGKTIKPTDIFINGAGVYATIRYAFKNAGGTYFRISQDIFNLTYSVPSRAGYTDEWLNGRADCDLVAYLTTIPTGGSITCYAFAERY